MYPNPIPVSNGTTTVNFDYRGSTPDASQYKDASATLDLPHSISVKHQTSKVNTVNQERRTLVRIDRTVENAEGVQGTLSVYLVCVIPEKVATSAQVTEQVTLMKSFLSASGYIAKIVAADI